MSRLSATALGAALLFATALLAAAPTIAQTTQRMDEAYAAKIAEYTTDPRFSNPLVDHLPYSDTVPSPLDHFGTIIGAPGILHYTDEIYGYFRALAEASPRVRVRVIGTPERVSVFIWRQNMMMSVSEILRRCHQR